MKRNWDYFKQQANFWEVESETVKGKKYIVRMTEEGLRCNCLDFLMREKEKGECKHIKKVRYKSKIGQKS